MSGQLRVAPSGAIIGWDLTVGFSFAAALGLDPLIAVEVLPVIEAVAVRAINQNILTALERDDG